MVLADSDLVKAIMTSSCEENVIASFHASHFPKLYVHMMVIAIFHVQPLTYQMKNLQGILEDNITRNKIRKHSEIHKRHNCG